MSMSDSCKDGVSKSSDGDGVFEVNDMLQNMNTEDKDISICANCGKEGDEVKNVCNKCKMVKFCNAACKKKHRTKHKKQCEEHVLLAAKQAAELHDIELFKQPPPKEDCSICFITLPLMKTGYRYMGCCGKVVCSGCSYAPVYDNHGNKVDDDRQNECPFCRTVAPKSEKERKRRHKKRMEADDPTAIYNQGMCYSEGLNGFPRDYTKALELFHRAIDLGYTEAYCNIGFAYKYGAGVEVDEKKAVHFYELAAIRGDVPARYNLGNDEGRAGNFDRALKHYMIAVRGGDNDSLGTIKQMYSKGYATKEDYTKALQSYQTYLSDVKSSQRDEAAAADEDYRYY